MILHIITFHYLFFAMLFMQQWGLSYLRILRIVLIKPLPGFIGLNQMFRRNIEGDISAGGKSIPLRAAGGKTYQRILPG